MMHGQKNIKSSKLCSVSSKLAALQNKWHS